jgi:hypothetical protein
MLSSLGVDVLPPPKLVTLLPEEEESKPPISPELKIVRRVIVDVAILVGLKVAMVFASRRAVKSIRELNKTNIPRQWMYEEKEEEQS